MESQLIKELKRENLKKVLREHINAKNKTYHEIRKRTDNTKHKNREINKTELMRLNEQHELYILMNQ